MNQAFSLPELATVIVIIAILATLGVNQYRSFMAKGRQAEAKLNLKSIADLQESYKYEKEEYNELTKPNGVGAFASDKCAGTSGKQMKNELGFRPSNCFKLRYGYWWTKGTAGNNYDDAKAHAKSTNRDDKNIYPGCKEFDQWVMKVKEKELTQSDAHNVIKKCE